MHLQELQLQAFQFFKGSAEAIVNAEILPELSILKLTSCYNENDGGAHLTRLSTLRYASAKKAMESRIFVMIVGANIVWAVANYDT